MSAALPACPCGAGVDQFCRNDLGEPVPWIHDGRRTHETRTRVYQEWGVRLATGEVRPQGRTIHAERAAHQEVERIARNAAREVGRSGIGIGWATSAHPAQVVSRTTHLRVDVTPWKPTDEAEGTA
jgi:hypothetical protein